MASGILRRDFLKGAIAAAGLLPFLELLESELIEFGRWFPRLVSA